MGFSRFNPQSLSPIPTLTLPLNGRESVAAPHILTVCSARKYEDTRFVSRFAFAPFAFFLRLLRYLFGLTVSPLPPAPAAET
jgi:hypothetical protein